RLDGGGLALPGRRRIRLHDRHRARRRRRADAVMPPLAETATLQPRIGVDALDAFCRAVLAASDADDATVDAATRAMMHGSRLGVDSHGVRLLDHYVQALRGGRVRTYPQPKIARGAGAVALLDADHGHGAL